MENQTVFDIEIIDYPARHLVGIHARTSIPNAATDCPPVWDRFMDRLKELPGRTKNRVYALFQMVDRRISFDYWVAVETKPNVPVPGDMEIFELPAGKYVCCRIPNRAATLMAYNAIYNDWVRDRDDYDVQMQGPCFELYPAKWSPNDPFDLYVPLIPRET